VHGGALCGGGIDRCRTSCNFMGYNKAFTIIYIFYIRSRARSLSHTSFGSFEKLGIIAAT